MSDLKSSRSRKRTATRVAFAPGIGDGLPEAVVEELAVGQAGDGVVVGQVVLELPRAFELGEHAVPFDGVAHGAQEQVAVDLALDQVVLGAFLDGADGEALIVQAGQHDDRGTLGACALAAAERLEAVAVRAATGRAGRRRRAQCARRCDGSSRRSTCVSAKRSTPASRSISRMSTRRPGCLRSSRMRIGIASSLTSFGSLTMVSQKSSIGLHDGDELVEVDRLGDVAVGVQVVAARMSCSASRW